MALPGTGGSQTLEKHISQLLYIRLHPWPWAFETWKTAAAGVSKTNRGSSEKWRLEPTEKGSRDTVWGGAWTQGQSILDAAPAAISIFFFFIAFTPTVVNQLLCCCCCSVLCFISFSHETMNLAKEGTTPDSLETILLRSSGVSCTQQVLSKCLRTY